MFNILTKITLVSQFQATFILTINLAILKEVIIVTIAFE